VFGDYDADGECATAILWLLLEALGTNMRNVTIRLPKRFSEGYGINEKAIDVIGIAKNELSICIEIFFVRNSKMIGREHYFLDNMHDEEIKVILSDFIKQYYLQKIDLPNKIMMQEKIDDEEIIINLLSERANRKIEFKVQQKGEKLRFIEMAINNAKITLDNKNKEKESIVLGLKEALDLENLPRRIESFDISNFSGDFMVAGMCVAIDGVIKKNLSKRFKIKTVETQNDVACTEEVVTRRLKHSIENPKGAFGNLPDLILADGGITQIRAIKAAINKYHLNIPVFGMVKDDKHNTKMLIDENRKQIPLKENLMNFITNLQTEVHNTAIEYNQKLMNKQISKSSLDQIKGIGPKKKQELLRKFGSIETIKKAEIEEIAKTSGINEELAKKIKNELE
jgi:excinuclease ABC subunit C